ncbi:MAG: hypothetical protein AAGU04_04015 [Anaerolineaceae bacterium]
MPKTPRDGQFADFASFHFSLFLAELVLQQGIIRQQARHVQRDCLRCVFQIDRDDYDIFAVFARVDQQ